MEEKPKYYNQSRNRATQKYIAANLEEVRFRVRKGERDHLKAAADSASMSMAQYIIQAINSYSGKQILTPSEGRTVAIEEG